MENTKIKLGEYEHYKGKHYRVIGVARHSETLEEVEIEGKKMPRFKYIND